MGAPRMLPDSKARRSIVWYAENIKTKAVNKSSQQAKPGTPPVAGQHVVDQPEQLHHALVLPQVLVTWGPGGKQTVVEAECCYIIESIIYTMQHCVATQPVQRIRGALRVEH